MNNYSFLKHKIENNKRVVFFGISFAFELVSNTNRLLDNPIFQYIAGDVTLKKSILLIVPILLLVAFPLLGPAAFADFFNSNTRSITSVIEPVYILLFGIGLTFTGSRG